MTANGWRKRQIMESADYERGFDDGFILRKEKDGDYKAKYLKVRDELAELQQREWQSLTDDEIKEIIGSYAGPIKGYTRELFDKIDAKLREKNGG